MNTSLQWSIHAGYLKLNDDLFIDKEWNMLKCNICYIASEIFAPQKSQNTF